MNRNTMNRMTKRCPCSEADRLLFVCINCGTGDPTPWVLGFAVVYFGVQLFKWAMLGFRIVG